MRDDNARREQGGASMSDNDIARGWQLATEMKRWIESASFESGYVAESMQSALDRWVAALTQWQADRAAALGWTT